MAGSDKLCLFVYKDTFRNSHYDGNILVIFNLMQK